MIVFLVCKGLDRRIYEGEEGGEKNCFIPDFDISESDVAFRLSLSRARFLGLLSSQSAPLARSSSLNSRRPTPTPTPEGMLSTLLPFGAKSVKDGQHFRSRGQSHIQP